MLRCAYCVWCLCFSDFDLSGYLFVLLLIYCLVCLMTGALLVALDACGWL